MYRRLLCIIGICFSLFACVPSYSGGSGYYRSEIYTAPAPYYYGGYHPYYVYPRDYYAPPPRFYEGPRGYYQGPRYYQPPRGHDRDRDHHSEHRPGTGPGHGNGWWGR